jgi:tRNA nucleotidyltransferase/poly(A) polymerase
MRQVPRDFDLTVSEQGRLIAEGIAEATAARFVEIGGDRFASYRVVANDWTVDIWDRQSEPLIQDLRRRDFTINSIACELSSLRLEDPLGGIADLAHRRLRASSENSFRGDPLRILRLVRFSTELSGSETDPQTLSLARESIAELSDVAIERIREEVKRSLKGIPQHQLIPTLTGWSDLGVYSKLWSAPGLMPTEAQDRRYTAPIDSLSRQMDRVSLPIDTEVLAHSLILCMLCDGVQSIARTMLRSLGIHGPFDKRTAREIDLVLSWEKLPQSEAETRWFLHSLGSHWTVVAHLLGALHCSRPDEEDRWEQLIEALMELARRAGSSLFSPPPLLTGGEIKALLSLEPGPQIRLLQTEIYRAQIEQRITTKREAERLVQRLATDSSSDDSTL